MPLPRVRFTVRRMMVAVAIVGATVAFGERRRRDFSALAEYHRAQQVVKVACSKGGFISEKRGGGMATDVDERADAWHRVLEPKYRYAARYPWLPVPPDPPEPQ